MKTFFIVLGSASVIYGAYLLHKKRAARAAKQMAGGSCGGSMDAALADGTVTGPSIQSTAGPVDNQVSMVEHFDSGKSKFPPMTYIGLPVEGYVMDNTSVYQPMQF